MLQPGQSRYPCCKPGRRSPLGFLPLSTSCCKRVSADGHADGVRGSSVEPVKASGHVVCRVTILSTPQLRGWQAPTAMHRTQAASTQRLRGRQQALRSFTATGGNTRTTALAVCVRQHQQAARRSHSPALSSLIEGARATLRVESGRGGRRSAPWGYEEGHEGAGKARNGERCGAGEKKVHDVTLLHIGGLASGDGSASHDGPNGPHGPGGRAKRSLGNSRHLIGDKVRGR